MRNKGSSSKTRFAIVNYNAKQDKAPLSQIDRGRGVLVWGLDNAQPLHMVNAIRRSVTASRAVQKRIMFTIGDGFDSLTNQLKVGNNTLYELLSESVSQYQKFRAVAFFVKYDVSVVNNSVKVKSIDNCPIENLRLKVGEDDTITDKLIYNPYFGTNEEKREDDREYYRFNPDNVINEVIERQQEGKKYYGQVYVYFEENEYSRFYPNPMYWGDTTGKGGGKTLMNAEFLLDRLLEGDVENGFVQQLVMNVVGDPDDPIRDDVERKENGESYTTVLEELQEKLDTEFSGVDAKRMLIFMNEISDNYVKLDAVPSSFKYEALKDIVASVQDRIGTVWDVPNVLLNRETSGAISKDDIKSAIEYMHLSVRPDQMVLENIFKELYKGIDSSYDMSKIEIKNYNPYQEIPEVPKQIWEVMSSEERRDYVRKNTNIELNDSNTLI